MLQFSQQKHDGPVRARMISALVGGDYVKWVGHLNLFWLWAANTGKDGAAPEGRLDGPDAARMLVGVIDYRGKLKPEELTEAWITAGVVAKTETGLRAKGVDCYAATVENAAARSEAGKKGAAARWANRNAAAQPTHSEPDATASEPHSDRNADAMRFDAKREIETKKEIEESLSEEREQVELQSPEASGGGDHHQHPLQELWNRVADPRLPRWEGMSPARKRIADARLKDQPLRNWEHLIQRVNASPFLCGVNERGWKASPDWVFKPANIVKVVEGNFDDKNQLAKPQQSRIGSPPLNNCAVCDQATEGGAIGEGIFACYPHVAAFRATAERSGWERPWEHAAEWVNAVRAQEAN